jgi:hypothetical protein
VRAALCANWPREGPARITFDALEREPVPAKNNREQFSGVLLLLRQLAARIGSTQSVNLKVNFPQ